MRYTQSFALLLLFFGSTSLAGQVPIPQISGPQLIAHETEMYGPQIVRVSYVQGEVKLSTGIKGSPDLGKDWIAAGVNFPIEEGVTLATEDGRAEVEFENGSMAYLAEHSVLQFDELTSNSEGTTTKVTLLTGRATFAIESNGHDDFKVDALKTELHTNEARIVRMESALDGATFRVLEGSFKLNEEVPTKTFTVGPGDAFQYMNEELSPVKDLQDDPDQQKWDQWVSAERTAQKADIAEGLKQSGLAAPIPGLVDLVRSGTFSDCAPYGKCWEPREESAQGSAPQAPSASPIPQQQNLGPQSAAGCFPNPAAGVRCEWVREDRFAFHYYDGPCGWGQQRMGKYYVDKLLRYSPQHPNGEVIQEYSGTDWDNWAGIGGMGFHHIGWWGFPWATCHAGSWVPLPRVVGTGKGTGPGCKPGKWTKCGPPKRKWVVGRKRKGGSFLRVKVGRREGFIPRHPLDVKGKRPLNAQDGVLTFHGKGQEEVAEIKSAPKDLQIGKSLPTGYDGNWVKNLPKVQQPVIEGRLLQSGIPSANSDTQKAGTQKVQPVIRYDYKTGNFVALSNSVGGALGKEPPVVIAHLGASPGSSGASYVGNSGGKPGSSGGSQGKSGGPQAKGGGSGGSSHGKSGSSGGGSSHSSGGGSSHTSSGGGGGGGSSHASSGGGGGGGGHPH
jgi:hypothetical protein